MVTVGESRRLVRFYEQMQMVGLDAERQPFVSEGGDARTRPQGHVCGAAWVVRRAPGMGDGAATRLGFASGAVALSPPGSLRELELSHQAIHLELAEI